MQIPQDSQLACAYPKDDVSFGPVAGFFAVLFRSYQSQCMPYKGMHLGQIMIGDESAKSFLLLSADVCFLRTHGSSGKAVLVSEA